MANSMTSCAKRKLEVDINPNTLPRNVKDQDFLKLLLRVYSELFHRGKSDHLICGERNPNKEQKHGFLPLRHPAP